MKRNVTIKANGAFSIHQVTDLSYTYFPLCNTDGMRSSISPTLGGDASVDQNGFLLVPTTAEDLVHSLMKRHVFFRVNDAFTWSITGQTPTQTLSPEPVDLHGDFLVHTLVRSHELFTCTIESFVPSDKSTQEWHNITVKNTTNKPLCLKPVIGIPIYGRSADTVRDHRHVTSLLNRVTIVNNGLINHPTLSFDERGHVVNRRRYGVFATSTNHDAVKHYHPTMEEFVGEGQTLLDPVVVKEETPTPYRVGDVIAGFEAMAWMEYAPITLNAQEELSLVVVLAIDEDDTSMAKTAANVSVARFNALKKATKAYWKRTLDALVFAFPNQSLNGWLRWVTLQPVLRRIYGNSFLPYHDYGRGGKGWRDLWQDLLALLLMNPAPVRALLINNFKGVRIDGSNATIIGDQPGDFRADRNNIARMWMDHGGWPLLTTKLYLDQSGDTEVLFEKTGYFRDQFTHHTKHIDPTFTRGDHRLKTHDDIPYEGTVLEHLLVQNLVPFYNVGHHNNLRLEDADWNDGLDMASRQGESVAFTSFYGQNLMILATMLTTLSDQGTHHIALCEEMDVLLKTVKADDIDAKHHVLKRYFQSVEAGVSGKHVVHETRALAATLHDKGMALLTQVRENEWLEDGEAGWFNGYYDDVGRPLDDVRQKHMTLTGQVFAIMSGAATDEQVQKIIDSADAYLYKEAVGGYRLNTNFNEVKTTMGRLFGFAYEHKENGAMFSHMAVMYANALYKRGFVKAGYKVIDSIYRQSINLKQSKMYPGIPEYFNARGRGMYPYLTGSASWLILTMVTEVFGIKGDGGLPVFEPKLLLEQFGKETELLIKTVIGDKRITVAYQNPLRLNYGEYGIGQVLLDGVPASFTPTREGVRLHQRITGTRVVLILQAKTLPSTSKP